MIPRRDRIDLTYLWCYLCIILPHPSISASLAVDNHGVGHIFGPTRRPAATSATSARRRRITLFFFHILACIGDRHILTFTNVNGLLPGLFTRSRNFDLVIAWGGWDSVFVTLCCVHLTIDFNRALWACSELKALVSYLVDRLYIRVLELWTICSPGYALSTKVLNKVFLAGLTKGYPLGYSFDQRNVISHGLAFCSECLPVYRHALARLKVNCPNKGFRGITGLVFSRFVC